MLNAQVKSELNYQESIKYLEIILYMIRLPTGMIYKGTTPTSERELRVCCDMLANFSDEEKQDVNLSCYIHVHVLVVDAMFRVPTFFNQSKILMICYVHFI